ncbi:hypothetical protein ACFL27_08270 [candidate division CSSED10-310 bacterium]|uniref:DUF2759 domain-containing protein n=1 Tax=candidate division CSSED10-310 bacterium TaxID=2855610 RepID=A0ABV6YVH6_UNCC1
MNQLFFLILAYVVTLVYSAINNEDNSIKTAFLQGFILFVGLVVTMTVLSWLIFLITPASSA